ncbi:MAG: LysM domain-containing protein [Planctomycetota bacterium]
MPAPAIATEKVVVKKGDSVWAIAKKYKVKKWRDLWTHPVNKKLHQKHKGNERKLDVKDVVLVPSDLSPLVEAPAEPITLEVGKKTYEFKDEKERDKFIKTIKVVEVKGKKLVFVGKEFDEFKKNMLREIRMGALLAAESRVNSAESLWKHFKDLNDDQYIVAWLVSLSGPDLPSGALIDRAILAVNLFKSAVNSGDFAKIEKAMKACEKPINEAYFAMKKYQKDIEGAGGKWLTALEYTKAGSFAIVGAIATPMVVTAAGSAALGSAIVGGGTALVSSASNEIGKAAVGTSEGTGEAIKTVALDTFTGATVNGLLKSDKGQELIKGATERVAKRFANKYLTKASTAALVKYSKEYMTSAGQSLFEDAVNEVTKGAKAKTRPASFMEAIAKSKTLGRWASEVDKAIDAEFAGSVYDHLPKSVRSTVFGSVGKKEAVRLIDDTLSGTVTSAGKALEGAMANSRGGDVWDVLKEAGSRMGKDKAFIGQLEEAAAVLN